MKKALIVAVALVLLCCGCSYEQPQLPPKITSEKAEETTTSTTAVSETATKPIEAADVDIDLTIMSSTMVYSEVYNMIYDRESYIGKTVRASGQFSTYYDDFTQQMYFAVLISDATACCQQGLEFKLSDELVYPDDYPTVDETITVEGVFGTYIENDHEYLRLYPAKIVG